MGTPSVAIGLERRGQNARAGFIFFFLIASAVLAIHYPLWDLPYFWDELGQFVPAALDIHQDGRFVPQSTLPNIHPPGIPLWLAAVWTLFGYSVTATRLAMLLLASVGAFLAFLLALRLADGVRGLPGLYVLLLLLLNPLFYTQSMMAQLDMPAMVFTLLALWLFLEERLWLAILACTVLVWVKETGIVLPVVMGWLLLREGRRREALLFALPCVSLLPWLGVLWQATGSIFGNREFAEFNLSYPLHPPRLVLALLRRGFELFLNHGYFLGALPLAVLWRRLPLFQRREWTLIFWFSILHILAVTVTGGAVLERYLLPVLPLTLIAFVFSWSHLRPRWRNTLPLATAVLSASGFFLSSWFPQPHENDLSMVRLVRLFQLAAREAESAPASQRIATAWPLSDALRRREFGYVAAPRDVLALRDFSPQELARAGKQRPDVMIWFSRDSLGNSWLFDRFPTLARVREQIYGWQTEDDAIGVEQTTGLREAYRVRTGGESMAIFRRAR
ncbi:MAG: DUF2079 domain-containing protein [Bryobacterales bacterium]|jgi:4-amino-4-deoxy-L-arabinose transferase-like glycosyltransferase|nr:DUF2079 domain-containing protein [Bryobacterales bacterium]